MKRCKECNIEKSETDFYISNKKTGSKAKTCKACKNERQKQVRKTYPEFETGPKQCKKCKQTKQITEFQIDRSRKGGYSHQCLECLGKSKENSHRRRPGPKRKPGRKSKGWYFDSQGYIRIIVGGKWVKEHRYIMEQFLGRSLRKEETIHHKNGDRADNRLENLELWSKKQPYGQRVKDKLEWAKEIIALYGECNDDGPIDSKDEEEEVFYIGEF